MCAERLRANQNRGNLGAGSWEEVQKPRREASIFRFAHPRNSLVPAGTGVSRGNGDFSPLPWQKGMGIFAHYLPLGNGDFFPFHRRGTFFCGSFFLFCRFVLLQLFVHGITSIRMVGSKPYSNKMCRISNALLSNLFRRCWRRFRRSWQLVRLHKTSQSVCLGKPSAMANHQTVPLKETK
jgi:hypothetical protein